jgi:predicted nucleic acid-binding protein
MMSTADALLLDTNVLVYALDESSPYHAACRRILDSAQSPDANLKLSPQSLAEFFSVVTNPRRVAFPKSTAEAISAVEMILALPGIEVLPVPLDVVSRWLELCRQREVKGGAIYDMQLLAVMLANDIRRVCTYNRADFEWIADIAVMVP